MVRKVTAFVLVAALLLTGCAKDDAPAKPTDSIKSGSGSMSESGGEDKPSGSVAFTAEEYAQAKKQAKILTGHLVNGGFRSYATDPRDTKKIAGKKPIDSSDINNFVMTTVRYTEQPDYLYSDFYIRTEEAMYLFPKENVNRQVHEVFGNEGDWDLQGGNTTYNTEKERFETGLEFGIGGSYSCKEIVETVVSEASGTVEVTFLLTDDLGFAGEPGWREQGNFIMSFQIMREDERLFLRYLKMEPSPSSTDNGELHRDILVNYGADASSDRDGERLEAHKGASLFQREDWSSEKPLSPYDFYMWNMGQLRNDDISPEEREKKYAHPSGAENAGWFFPQKLYEDRAQQYFEVTAEYLRTAQEYDAKNEGYAAPGGGGIGATPKIALYNVEQADDILKLHLTLIYNEYNQEGGSNEYKILSVRLSDDGSYRYIAYETEKNPPKEQIDAAFTAMPGTAAGESAVYVCEELGFTATFPSSWESNYTAMITDSGFQNVEEQGRGVGFYYKGDTSVPILYITAVPAIVWEQVKEQQLTEGVKLGENEKYVFVATPFGRRNPFNGGGDKELFDSMYIEKEQVGDKLKFELK